MVVLNFVNSFIGKKGNIGLRTSYIIDKLNDKGVRNFSYSRGCKKEYKKNNKNMLLLGHLPRVLNAVRIYINLWFNHRKYDILLFNKFFQLCFNDVHSDCKIAHIWEYSPYIIKKLNKKRYITILDVPIAPTGTSMNLNERFGDSISLHPHAYNYELEIASYEAVDYIIAPSRFVKDEIVKLGVASKKIFVVPFGAELNDGYVKGVRKNYEKEGIDFCFAGTINKRKGVEFLLKAWSDSRFSRDRLHLCGRLFPEIDDLLKEYNFKNVITPGFVSTNEYFKNCDVYVFPSLLEGSSKSIYEAMNMSLPCIVTPNSGSIVQDGLDGFIVEVASSESILTSMLRFKNDNTLIEKMGNNAHIKIQNYSWVNYANNIFNIYEKVSQK